MKIWTKTLSRIMIVLSVFSVSGCFVNEVKVTGSLAPTSLGLPSNILLQNTTTINVQDLDITNLVGAVSSLSIDISADCRAIDLSTEMMGFAPAAGEVNLDGRIFTAVNSLCVESTYAQSQTALYAGAVEVQGMSNDQFLKSCSGTDTCENLRIAIFILEDSNNNTYGMQLELLGETATSTPLTLLTIVGDGKLEYYGEIITSTPSPSPNSQISTAITTLLSLDIDGLNTSKKNKKKLEKDLQGKKVIKELEEALKPEYWSSDNTLTEAGGDKVFKGIAKAMKTISKAKDKIIGESNDVSITALVDTLNDIEASLVDSMRTLAAERIAAAQVANGNAGSIASAMVDYAKGEAEVIAEKFDKAIKSYGDSWNELSGAF